MASQNEGHEAATRRLLKAQTHGWNHIFSFINSVSLRSAIELNIPDIIHKYGKPMPLPLLASSLQIQPSKAPHLRRLMRFLTHIGFFSLQKLPETSDDPEGYVLTDTSTLFLKDHPFTLAPQSLFALEPVSVKPWEHLPAWFQNNDPTPFETAYGKAFYDYAYNVPSAFNNLRDFMAGDSKLVVKVLIEQCRDVFKGCGSLVDVGGSTGTMAKAASHLFQSNILNITIRPSRKHKQGQMFYEFSTMRQQDALEFFLHFLDQVDRVNPGKSELDPAISFKFGVEDRILCSSGKVAYNRRHDYILSLNIPLHEATNKEELEAFNKLNAEKLSEGKEVSRDDIVRPRVPLESCLASFSAPEEINDFYSTALKAKTTAVKMAGLTSFPDYLVLHMRKFVMGAGWVPKKLDVYIDVPDIIDISHMRSKGHQPGEELLPDGVPDEEDSSLPVANEEIVSQLASMGFQYLHCQKAAINTSNVGVEEAMNWLLSHMDDPDIDNPINKGQNSATSSSVDQSKVDMLISFGFQEELARKALKASGEDIEKATDWIFSNPDASFSSMDATSSGAPAPNDTGLPDGGGRYRLMGIVSHIGTSTQCGHYVAHILKDGKWVIFNDNKVGASINPPKEMGYLYFFERLND